MLARLSPLRMKGGASVDAPPGGDEPYATVDPVIQNTPRVGLPMIGVVGAWANSPTSYNKQWYRATTEGGTYSAISGASDNSSATTLSYTPVGGDETYYFKFEAAGVNADGTGTAVRSASVGACDAVLTANLNGPADIEYEGFFSLPNHGHSSIHDTEHSLENCAPIGFGPDNTFYLTGHPSGSQMNWLNEPSIGGTATVAGDSVDIGTDLGGGLDGIAIGKARSAYYSSALDIVITALGGSYDANSLNQYSHIVVNPDMSGKTGPWRVKWLADTTYGTDHVTPANAFFNAGGMCDIPAEWQTDLGGPVLSAQGNASIVTRTPWGHAFYSFNPELVGDGTYGSLGTPVPAYALCIHPYWSPAQENMQVFGERCDKFNTTDAASAVAFRDGTDSVLVFGIHGDGIYDYGPGTSDPDLAGTIVPGTGYRYCLDPCSNVEGNHAWPVQYEVWAYDANNFASVKAGSMLPEEVRPYAVWKFDNIPAAAGWGGGAFVAPVPCVSGYWRGAFKPSTNRLYMSQGDGKVHIFHIKAPGA